MNSRRQTLIWGVLAGLLAWSLLTASALIGMHVPAAKEIAAAGRQVRLDYSAQNAGFFEELTREFIDRILGFTSGEISAARQPSSSGERGAPGVIGSERFTDLHPLTNDNLATARHIPGLPYTARSDVRGATREPNEASSCAAVGDNTVWYRYRPPTDIGLLGNTFGSNYATALGVFKQVDGSLVSIGCDTDGRGNAIVPLSAKKNTDYFFQIVGPAGGGDLVFNLETQGRTSLVSVSPTGGSGDSQSSEPSSSGDGSLVAFTSTSSNMGCPQFPCFPYQIYVRNRSNNTTTMVSVSSAGKAGNFESTAPFLSGNGRYVAFESNANNLVPGDTNNAYDIFVHDLSTRETERVSVSSLGAQQIDNSPSWPGARFPAMSWDGRFVVFESRASNLVPNDNNGTWDAFVHDRETGVTERVSVNSKGEERGDPRPLPDQEATRLSEMTPSISGDGRVVAFRSYAANLVPGDGGTLIPTGDSLNGVDTYVHDRVTRMTTRVSVSSTGEEAFDGGSHAPGRKQLSFDGRYVAFNSYASNLTPGDRGPDPDAFVHDRITGRTVRVSVSSSGDETLSSFASDTGRTTISEDGRYVAFDSDAPNLVPGDDNGTSDVFVHDLVTRTTVRVSVTGTGDPMHGSSSSPCLSADGRAVVFQSAAVLPTEGGFFYLPVGEQYQIYVHEPS